MTAASLQVLLPHREDVKLESVVVCEKYLVAFERLKGLQVKSTSGPATWIDSI